VGLMGPGQAANQMGPVELWGLQELWGCGGCGELWSWSYGAYGAMEL
jgi:hypothetical protein